MVGWGLGICEPSSQSWWKLMLPQWLFSKFSFCLFLFGDWGNHLTSFLLGLEVLPLVGKWFWHSLSHISFWKLEKMEGGWANFRCKGGERQERALLVVNCLPLCIDHWWDDVPFSLIALAIYFLGLLCLVRSLLWMEILHMRILWGLKVIGIKNY